MKLTQEQYDALYVEWTTRHPESTHFVVICNDCHSVARPGHDCATPTEAADAPEAG